MAHMKQGEKLLTLFKEKAELTGVICLKVTC